MSPVFGKRTTLGLRMLAGAALAASTLALPAAAQCTHEAAKNVWERWEGACTSSGSGNLYQTRSLKVTYTLNGTATAFTGYGFWDGGQTFRFRTAFPKAGTWQWRTTCEGCTTDAMHNRDGSVQVTLPSPLPSNDLYRHGFLKVRQKRYLAHDDGYKFHWVGDTAWVAPLRATDAQWNSYVADRKQKGFNVVQLAGAHCWAYPVSNADIVDAGGNKPFRAGSGNPFNEPEPQFWREYDKKVQKANQNGMVALVVALMAQQTRTSASPDGSGDYCNGIARYMPQADAQRFARYLGARLAGDFVLFSPGFDSDPYQDNALALMKAVGAAIDAAAPRHLVTTHLGTDPRNAADQAGYNRLLHGETWLDAQFVQSGFGCYSCGSYDPLDLALGRARSVPRAVWDMTPTKPLFLGEGAYDESMLSNPRPQHTPERVRQIGYLSRLSGAFGYTYGARGLWDWGTYPPPSDPLTSLGLPSASQMGFLRRIFASVEWWRLRPRETLIRNQPTGSTNEEFKMVLGVTDNNRQALAYLPLGQNRIEIDFASLTTLPTSGRWVDPATGLDAGPATGTLLSGRVYRFNKRSGTTADRVLALGATSGASATTVATWSAVTAEGGAPAIYASFGNSDVEVRVSEQASDVVVDEHPAHAGAADGTTLIAWERDAGFGREIWVRVFDAGGTPRGAELQLAGGAGSEAWAPRVAVDAAGLFTLIWQESAEGSEASALVAQRFDPARGALERVAVADLADHSTVGAALGSTPAGESLIVWERETEAGESALLARGLDAYGVLAGAETLVSSAASGGRLALVGVAASGAGGFDVRWRRYDPSDLDEGTYARPFDADGQALGPEALVEPPGSEL